MNEIPFSRVVCDGNELAYVREVLESGWLTSASKAREFEERFAERVEARHACAVNSCTAALHLALESAGVGAGDRVIVPTMTFTATAEVVRYLDADPVFVDVEYGTNLVTPEILRDAFDRVPDAKAVIVVHFGGQAVDLRPGADGGIEALCRARGVALIEDAAHAFPAREGGRPIGSIGDATCFSFYANKTITTGEGGMVTTDDDALADRIRVLRLHGIDRDVWRRFTHAGARWEYDVVAPGYKDNLPDLSAAVGLAQLERADEFRSERERCVRRYSERLARLEDHVDLPRSRVEPSDHAWHLFPIVVRPGAARGRNEIIERLAEAGIGTSVHYKPLHRMTYYRDRYDLRPEDFPNAERAWQGSISLPLYPTLTDDEIDFVCERLAGILT